MTIPDYQSIMLPLLTYAGDGQDHSFRDAVTGLAEQFDLADEERRELLPSGRQPTFDNRVGWARTYLLKAGLLDSPRRGRFCITDRGRQVLQQKPPRIDVQFLEQFPEFIEFRQLRRQRPKPEVQDSQAATDTPEEALEDAYQRLRDDLAAELLDTVKQCSPEFFERLVIDLLIKMGYGGSRREAGQAVGKTGDGGIDGIIKEDKLGLDVIYIQAERWEGTVGRPEVQKFAGALQGQRAAKGIFITTSGYTREAVDFASHLQSKIILIDGARLADLMIDHEVGVSPVALYAVKRVDSDYFTGD